MRAGRTERSSPVLPELSGTGIDEDTEVELGRVSGVFGVHGEVRLFLHNPESELLDQPRDVILVGRDGRRRKARLSARSGAGKRILGRIDGITTPEQARELMEERIAIAKSALPEPEEDEWYVHQLVGLAATVGGERIGTVIDVHATDAGDILEIDLGEESVFVPAIRELVLEVDVAGGRVEIDPQAFAE